MKSNIHYAIISHLRPENVEKMEEITGIPEKLNWYVGKDEAKDYADAKGTVTESGNLVDSRNSALREANAESKYCMMLDDDLASISMFNAITTCELSFANLAKEMYKILQSLPLYVAGVSATGNHFYFDPLKPISIKHFIIASCMLTKYPSEIFFDAQFKTKEDYDFTLQHIKKYGGVARINYLAPRFQHYTNKGGVVEYRTNEIEQDSITKLKRKWGDTIRPNTRRGPNEILLKIN